MAIKGLRLKLNNAGVRALLASAEISSDLENRGNRIAQAAGDGVEVEVTKNRDRTVVFVTTETTDAKKAEAEDRALTRAIDAGR